MKHPFSPLLGAALWLLLWFLPVAQAADTAPAVAPAVTLVEQTAQALARDSAATLAAINAGEAPYRDPQDPTRYVFVYDLGLTVVAHPNPELVGRNMKGVPDSAGKQYRDEILAGALRDGKGWEDYHYAKPGSSGFHPKRTFYEKVTGSDGHDYIVCSGIYLD